MSNGTTVTGGVPAAPDPYSGSAPQDPNVNYPAANTPFAARVLFDPDELDG